MSADPQEASLAVGRQDLADSQSELVPNFDRFAGGDRFPAGLQRQGFVAMGVKRQHRSGDQINNPLQRHHFAGQRHIDRRLDRQNGLRIVAGEVNHLVGRVRDFWSRCGGDGINSADLRPFPSTLYRPTDPQRLPRVRPERAKSGLTR